MLNFFYCDDKILPLGQLPATIIELGQNARLDTAAALRGTGIFLEDIARNEKQISSEQFLRLCQNMQRQDKRGDLALRFGRRLPYAISGDLLKAISNASHVVNLLEIIRNQCRLYFPFVCLHLTHNRGFYALVIADGCGLGTQAAFIKQSFLSSLVTLIKNYHLDSSSLSFLLEFDQPENNAQLATYLGSQIQYNAPVTGLLIPTTLAQQPLSESSDLIRQQSLRDCRHIIRRLEGRYGFVESLHRYMLRKIPKETVTLQSCCDAFRISPATMKRRLKHHQTNFQYELDQAKKLLALSYMVIDDMTNEAIAQKLGINDNANFRRSFKRWTGLLPSTLRNQITLREAL
ncbi:AraC family transcriptional regulator [Maricurvus nonylphenolicus]|uniref:helix-turn-helix domain-containing protein n=1 Tax=Maricurvus nonylphenolicus TaxID=1008307 RepID=UPI0036F2627F